MISDYLPICEPTIFPSNFFLETTNKRIFEDGLLLKGLDRDPKWDKLRNTIVDKHPFCSACGCADRKQLIVHHIKPFHLFPKLELVEKNCIVLCERKAFNCHWIFGHCGHSWKHYNPNVRKTVLVIANMIKGCLPVEEPKKIIRVKLGIKV